MQCGFRQDGQPLLNVGVTVLDEGKLTFGEREFIKAMVDARLAEQLPDAEESPAAPASGTQLTDKANDIVAAVEEIAPTQAAPRKRKGRAR